MAPPADTPNPIQGPGENDFTSQIHNDTYDAISPTNFDLSGKAIFISGGSKGIGRAMTLSFARAGASYIAVGARSDMSSLERDVMTAAKEAGRKAPTFLPVKFDCTDQKSTEEAAAKVEKDFGHCDIVINNAGIVGQMAPILDSDPNQWWQVWNVNLRGPYLVVKAFLPLLLKGGDKTFVTVGSVGAHLVMPGLSSYQTTKLAVLRFTEFLGEEYKDQGVLAYTIHPGNVKTDIMGDFDAMPEELKRCKFGRFATQKWPETDSPPIVFTESPEISADSLVYLTSEKREWLQGRYINVTWNMPELMAKKDEIVEGDKLKVRLVL